jgi:hypothetical protein
LTSAQDEPIRSTLAAVYEPVLTHARHVGVGRAAWKGTNLELNLDRAGRFATISSYVEYRRSINRLTGIARRVCVPSRSGSRSELEIGKSEA